MNFDLSELDKLSDAKSKGSRPLPKFLSAPVKVKFKGDGRREVTRSGTNEDAEFPTTRTLPASSRTARLVAKEKNEYNGDEGKASKKSKKKVPKDDALLADDQLNGAAGVKEKVSQLIAEKIAIKNGKEENSSEKTKRRSQRKRREGDIPTSHAALLESIAQGDMSHAKGMKAGIRRKNIEAAAGLEELHRALHLSKYEGVDDRSKVIQAEPLEIRKQRMIEKEQEKKKTKVGRPGKKDPITKTLLELKNKQKRDAEASNEKNKATRGSSEETEVIDNGKETSSYHQRNLRRSKRLKMIPTEGGSLPEDGHIRNNLADKELDAESWSLKEIVRWGNARERKMAKKDKGKEERTMERNDAVEEDKEPKSFAPQVKVKDGKVVVNRESLTVAAQQKEEYTRVVNEEVPRLNSMSYVNRLSNDRWSVEDTELFFRALSQFGTDFTLIAQLFPGRQRKHLKKKFCKEGKINAARIDAAMRASAHGTVNSYKEMINLLKESGMSVGQQTSSVASESEANKT